MERENAMPSSAVIHIANPETNHHVPDLELHRAIVYRLYPTPEQAARMARIAGACRFAHNLALEQRRAWWRPGRRFSFAQQCRELTELRREVDWLADCPVHALQSALRDVDRAFANFFAGRAAYPQFRRKGDRQSYRQPDPATFAVRRTGRRTGQVRLPKIGWVRLRGWRALPGEARSLTVSCRAGQWFVSVMCRIQAVDPAPSQLPAIGIDRGVAATLATSDGRLIAGPNAYKAAMARLQHLQRSVARKTKGSANRAKAVAKLARAAARVADVRLDWLHRTTTTIAKTHGVVVLEDLRTKSMSRSARGSVETPGRNVRAKSGLNRAILDQGWSAFQGLLDYKLRERRGELVLVSPAHTSQTCACCGHRAAANRRRRDLFACVACGHTEHADTNAAKIILRQGLPSMPVEGRGCAPGEAGTIPELAA